MEGGLVVGSPAPGDDLDEPSVDATAREPDPEDKQQPDTDAKVEPRPHGERIDQIVRRIANGQPAYIPTGPAGPHRPDGTAQTPAPLPRRRRRAATPADRTEEPQRPAKRRRGAAVAAGAGLLALVGVPVIVFGPGGATSRRQLQVSVRNASATTSTPSGLPHELEATVRSLDNGLSTVVALAAQAAQRHPSVHRTPPRPRRATHNQTLNRVSAPSSVASSNAASASASTYRYSRQAAPARVAQPAATRPSSSQPARPTAADLLQGIGSCVSGCS
jgi:hypothetical protein